jgi:hypothetical protein
MRGVRFWWNGFGHALLTIVFDFYGIDHSSA